MRKLTKYETAAMWLFGNDYAESGLSAIDYWRKLDRYKRVLVARMVDEIESAPAEAEEDAHV